MNSYVLFSILKVVWKGEQVQKLPGDEKSFGIVITWR